MCSIGASVAGAQSLPVGDPLEDYARVLQLTGSLPLEPVGVRPGPLTGLGAHVAAVSADPWRSHRRGRVPRADVGSGPVVEVLPVELRSTWNSARPWGFNDGALWQGRGGTVAATGGALLRWGPLRAALRPIAIRNENRGFALSPLPRNTGLGPFSYPSGIGQTLDMPQRFGDGAFTTYDLGNSFVRAEAGPVAAGLSNESMWWGPGRRNGMTMSNHAPGFGHVFLGTSRPADIRVGRLYARWVWGRLRESRYFDADPDNDSRYLTGLVATLSPQWIPGLELGAARSFVMAWDGIPALNEALLVFVPLQKARFVTPENPSGDDETDQMASLFFRWAMPTAGFEFYGEWARGDHSRDLRDLYVEPEHASGWMVGFQKAFEVGNDRVWRLASELTLLGSARTTLLRAPASAFYVHHIVRQGYTQRGQVLGAGIGPGSSQFFVGLDRFAPWGRAGIGYLRTVYDNNRFYAEPRSHHTHEVEGTMLAEALVFRGPWDVGFSVAAARLLNKWYVERNDERNVNLQLLLRYHPGSR